MYNQQYSQVGFSQQEFYILIDTTTSNVVFSSNLEPLIGFLDNYNISININSNYNSLNITSDNYNISLILNSSYISEVADILEDTGTFSLNFDSSYINEAFAIQLAYNYIEKIYNNYDQPYSRVGFSQSKMMSYSLKPKSDLVLDVNYDSTIPGRLLFKGKIFSQGMDAQIV